MFYSDASRSHLSWLQINHNAVTSTSVLRQFHAFQPFTANSWFKSWMRSRHSDVPEVELRYFKKAISAGIILLFCYIMKIEHNWQVWFVISLLCLLSGLVQQKEWKLIVWKICKCWLSEGMDDNNIQQTFHILCESEMRKIKIQKMCYW